MRIGNAVFAVPAFAVLAAVLAAARAEAAEPPLVHDWYRVEIVLFERPYVRPQNQREVLLEHGPRSFERGLLAFALDPEERAARMDLSAESQALPEYPPPLQGVRAQQARAAWRRHLFIDEIRSPERPRGDPNEPLPGSESGDTAPTPGLDIVTRAFRRYEEGLMASSYRLEQDDLTLTGAAGALERSDAFRVVLHAAWTQPVPARDAPAPVLIQAGDKIGNRFSIEGSLAITLGRYLHVHAHLWWDDLFAPRSTYRRDPTPRVAANAEADVAASMEIARARPAYMEMNQRRRLESGALHYLDHPRLGLLIRVDPIELPAALAELQQSDSAP